MNGHAPFVVEVFEPSSAQRVHVLIGNLLTAIDVRDLPDGRQTKWMNAGCKSVVIVAWLSDKQKELGCFASIQEIANAIDARVVEASPVERDG